VPTITDNHEYRRLRGGEGALDEFLRFGPDSDELRIERLTAPVRVVDLNEEVSY
jgi:hypothetical protein